MRYQYVVILKRNSEKTTDRFSLLLCLLSAVSFLYFAVSEAYSRRYPNAHTWFLSLASGILLIGLAVNLIARRKKNKQIRYRVWLIVAAIGWFGMTTMPFIAPIFFVLAALEYQTKRPLEIGFDLDRVVINSLWKRRFAWTDFNNVILKDGLLTLDFKDDHLIQKEVADDDDEDDADEEEFNMYCRERLAVAARNLV